VEANNPQESTQASRELLTYIRKLLRPTSLSSSAVGPPNIKSPIAQSGGTGTKALTQGERASGGPRQLQAEAITRSSKSSSGGSAGFKIGNNWVLSPIAGVLNSILGLFGAGGSTSQVTRYRAQTREPFQIVEVISPETGAGVQTINESASGLFGVTRSTNPEASSSATVEAKGSGAPASAPPSAQADKRTVATSNSECVDWVRRLTGGASSTERPVVKAERSLNRFGSPAPSIAHAETQASSNSKSASAGRLTGSAGSPESRAAAVERRTSLTEESTGQRRLQKDMGTASSQASPTGPVATWAHGNAAPTNNEAASLMNDRQGLVAALRRSLSDSRGIADVLNEFQDGL